MAEKTSRYPKSVETRSRLREATEACLFELGYVGTSTVEVCQRAGLSRGALLHHYPTRHELIVDTARHFWARAETSMDDLAEALGGGRLDVRGFVEGVFQQVFGPRRIAITLELIVATRSDETLRTAIAGIFSRLIESYQESAARALLRSGLSQAQIGLVVSLVASTLRGLWVQQMLMPDEAMKAATIDSLIYAVERILASGPERFREAVSTDARRAS